MSTIITWMIITASERGQRPISKLWIYYSGTRQIIHVSPWSHPSRFSCCSLPSEFHRFSRYPDVSIQQSPGHWHSQHTSVSKI